MISVDEILRARPARLSERAAAAWAQQQEAEAAELAAEGDQLANETYVWLKTVLGLGDPELADVEFVRSLYNSVRAQVEFSADGLEFRARYKLEKIHEIDRSGTKEPIFDLILFAEVKAKGSWYEVTSLEKLGALLAP